MLYRQGNADFSHPIWLCRFCRCWSTQYGRLQGAATISCRRSDSCHSTSTVHERHTTLLHNIAQVGLLRKHRVPQVPIRNILSTPLGVSFILFSGQPTRQVQNSINIPSLQQVWVSPQQFQLSSADWLYLIRLASLRELKNHLGQHLEWPCSILFIRMPSSRPWHYTLYCGTIPIETNRTCTNVQILFSNDYL